MALEAIDPHTALMTWDPPPQVVDEIYGYEIQWRIGSMKQKPILSKTIQYTFTDLMSGQSLSAAVRTIPNKYLYEERSYGGPLSYYTGTFVKGVLTV